MQYAIRHPAHFIVMFSPELADKSRHPSLQQAARSVHDILIERIRTGQREGLVAPGDPTELAFAAWSLVHGCAVLLVDGRGTGARPDDLIESVVQRLYAGLAPRPPQARRPPARRPPPRRRR